MNPNHLAALRALEQAQKLRASDPKAARVYAIQAAQLAPEMEEPWLMLAAVSSPRASIAYIEKALEISPQSARAQKGMEWAVKRLREYQEKHPERKTVLVAATKPAAEAQAAGVEPAKKADDQPLVPYVLVLFALFCLAGLAILLWQVSPAIASMSGDRQAVNQPQTGLMVQSTQTSQPMDTPAPTQTAIQELPVPVLSDTPLPTFTALALPADPIIEDTALPTEDLGSGIEVSPSETPQPTLDESSVSEEPTLQAEPSAAETSSLVISDVPTAESPAPPTAPAISHRGERWVDVDLTNQMLYAYEGDQLVGSFVVSTGTWEHPTVIGQYRVYLRYQYKDMSGPGYYLPNVPNTMFFYQGYAIHGTYWHNNFGTPMSHGCVNMTIADSEWLYNWSPTNLLVNVHY